jgi:hypothetical protein
MIISKSLQWLEVVGGSAVMETTIQLTSNSWHNLYLLYDEIL